ncbi:MAG: Hpt domain-containing protein, partial [Treponema sp.]|nr:Hpt domain-containing protein [Treponema sp.]
KRETFTGETGIVIPGVDVQKGINMTGGTLAGYCKVLAQFYKDASERLPWFKGFSAEKDLENNDKFPAGKLDREDFARNLPAFSAQAHAIKSAAGTIGAAEVSEEAAALEAAGKAGDTVVIRETLPGFYKQLAELVYAIGKEIEEEFTTKDTKDTKEKNQDVFVLKEKCASLKIALEAKNMEEIDSLLGELEKMPLDGEERGKIDAVSDLVLMGEYEKALQMIGGKGEHES